ncbi:MAG TPA: acetate kinase [Micromonosporaceae bacterium]|nr:acetate kinase [Micromonosporaceae bacterium]
MILVLNAGSSSVKYRLVDGAATAAHGVVERIGEPGSPVADHAAALRMVAGAVQAGNRDVTAVGHRVVHGGSRFTEPTLIDDAVVAGIRALIPLAPLHNPACAAGIDAARGLWPGVPQVAVFDTAFHATIPAAAATYAIDAGLAGAYGIRRYGFHGTSHRYVSRRTADLLGRAPTELNLIVLHLGNGASACAVAGGRSVETSMGFTPLEGLVMGTRSGDLDPGVVFHLARAAAMTLDEIEGSLQHRAGLAGLSGDNDMRTVLARAAAGDVAARLAIDVYCHRIRKYIGAYHAVLGRLDAIAFTAGVGENSPDIRAEVANGLAALGIHIDPERNAGGDTPRVISPDSSSVAVCVVPTDEELEIAEQVVQAVAG